MEKGEGLVLKPDDPYFNFAGGTNRFGGLCIKLKKEYIGRYGDAGDFAVIGAGFNATKAKTYGIENLKWTHFFVGCLENKEELQRWNTTPKFTVVTVVELNEAQLRTLIRFSNPIPVELDEDTAANLTVPKGLETTTPLSVVFQNPPIFDMRCFSFDRPGNMGFWTLRFPSVSKIHSDRDLFDTVTFTELQEMAKEATTLSELEDSQENLAWIAKLERADPRGQGADAVSQLTASTMPTPSPAGPRQDPFRPDLRASPMAVEFLGRACDAPGRTMTPLQGSNVSAVPPIDLIPPNSASLPSAEATRNDDAGLPEKRALSPGFVDAPPRKRRRSNSFSACSAEVPARTPLAAIDGNSSEQPVTQCTSVSATPQRPGEHAMCARRGLSLVDDNHVASKFDSTESQQAPTSSVGSRENSIERPGPMNAEEHIKTASLDPSPASSCSYAGIGCRLAGSVVLLSSKQTIIQCAEPVALLKAHGVFDTAVCAHEWLKSQDQKRARASDYKGRNMILLVESVDQASETKQLLEKLEAARAILVESEQGWISVYDWRFLRGLTMLEDSSILRKYYDGFSDPSRRWYCGMV
ncbi:hypothetical protein DCS_02663 [Drechmeria coniospora]|uniref:ATP-dependent DNA ligase family profile domain-containing protein n=1 Tax=Drechmeria coniospora TaxID=98403 RepID=A0A151GWS4_DRECN|nr:hypothetical protein DCS_02663 [Drechmeria coniospora]KYK61521.1 hypothetical protein DCS_02663 [Drechmeria coniospora]